MRLGVLDIGSNTGHLLVVDAYRGAAPLPASSSRSRCGSPSTSRRTARVSRARHRRARRVRRPRPRRWPRTRAARRSTPSPPRRCATPTTATTCSRHVEDDRRRDQGAARRGRGPADLPRRTPLVRLVVGPPRRLRHRRRLARDRRRRRRVARRGLVAAARRRPADPRALRRRPLPRRGAMRKLRKQIRTEIAHDAGTLLRGGAARPRGRHLEDVPLAGPHLRRRALRARACSYGASSPAADLDEWIPKLLEMDARRHRRAAGRLDRPRPPGASRARSSPRR